MPTCVICATPLTGRQTVVCTATACRYRRMYDQQNASGYRQRRRERPEAREEQRQRNARYVQRKQTFHCEMCGAEHTNRLGEQDRFCSRRCAEPRKCAVPDSHPSRSTPVPPEHPARWCGARTSVIWSICGWCERLTCGQAVTGYCSDSHRWAAKSMRRRGRQSAATGTYTWGDVMRLFLKFDRRCAYCLQPVAGQPDPDHVIPLSRGGGNTVSNLLPACRRCNSEKCDRTPDEWAEWRASTGRPSLPFTVTDPRWSHLALNTARARAS